MIPSVYTKHIRSCLSIAIFLSAIIPNVNHLPNVNNLVQLLAATWLSHSATFTLQHSFMPAHLSSKIYAANAMAFTQLYSGHHFHTAITLQHSSVTVSTYASAFTPQHFCCCTHTAALFRPSVSPLLVQQLSCSSTYAAFRTQQHFSVAVFALRLCSIHSVAFTMPPTNCSISAAALVWALCRWTRTTLSAFSNA